MGSNTNDWSKAFEGYGKQAQSVGSEEEERPRFEHNPFGSDSDEEILEDEYKKLKQSKRIHKLLERIIGDDKEKYFLHLASIGVKLP